MLLIIYLKKQIQVNFGRYIFFSSSRSKICSNCAKVTFSIKGEVVNTPLDKDGNGHFDLAEKKIKIDLHTFFFALTNLIILKNHIQFLIVLW